MRGVSAFTRELARGPQAEESPMVLPARPKIGIALGGGFARGLAHIGVLKVLDEEGIAVDYLAGTSIGSVIGALYCSGITPREMQEIAALLKFSDFARFTISRLGFYNNDRLGSLLKRTLKAHTFEELRIPLAVTTTDFTTGEPAVFTSGPLADVVRASCAYPGFFHPVNVNGRLLVDGLLAYPVPAAPLKHLGAEKVIAVYFNSHWCGEGGPKNMMQVVGQCFSIAQANLSTFWQAHTDVVLEPDVSCFAYDAFNKSAGLIAAGEAAMRAALPQVKAWLAVPEPMKAPAPQQPVLAPVTVPIAG